MAVVLTWNPEEWPFPVEQYESMVKQTEAGQTYADDWTVGRRVQGIDVGDRVFLFRQGRDRRGLVASGVVAPGPEVESPIFPSEHWDGSGREANYVNVDWDRVVEVDERLPIGKLLAEHTGFSWNSVYESGRPIDGEALASLERMWQDWTGPSSSSVDVVLADPEQHDVQEYWSQGSEAGLRTLAEALLCQRYLDHLTAQGINAHRHRIQTEDGPVLRTDLYDPQRDELIEAKSSTSRPSVRLGIGQLYDYRRYLDPTPTSLAMLLPTRPTDDLLALLTGLAITAIWPDDAIGFIRT